MLNQNCYLQNECERTCKYQLREKDCDYYKANQREDFKSLNIDYIIGIDEEQSGQLLTYIPISKLFPHPDNPRKDLGELEELAESIKSKGVLQNLTVVPWFSEITRKPLDDAEKQKEMGYRILIGHRRCAAAKLAGLQELPCVITEMSEHDQVATMLLENMQRSDLSVYEQAKGFQMMLDLGDSVKNIANQTGFSSTTIRKRVNLLQLDEQTFKETSSRGATLEDYVSLEKIKNVERKNKVLSTIGTSNFNNELKKALEVEQREEIIDEYEEKIKTFATKIEKSEGNMRFLCNYGTWRKIDVEIPDDAGEKEYFYIRNTYGIDVSYKIPENELTQTEKLKKEAEERARKTSEKREQLRKLAERAFEMRFDFIKNFNDCKSHVSEMVAVVLCTSRYYYSLDKELFCKLEKVEDSFESKTCFDESLKMINSSKNNPEKTLLNILYATIDSENHDCHTYSCKFAKNEELQEVYEILGKLGYEQSNEEKAYLTGTHELFEK